MLDFICSPLENFYAIHVLDHSLLDLGLPYLEKIVVSVRPWINIGGCCGASTALETKFARLRRRVGKIPTTTGSPGLLVEARSVLIAPTRLHIASNVSFQPTHRTKAALSAPSNNGKALYAVEILICGPIGPLVPPRKINFAGHDLDTSRSSRPGSAAATNAMSIDTPRAPLSNAESCCRVVPIAVASSVWLSPTALRRSLIALPNSTAEMIEAPEFMYSALKMGCFRYIHEYTSAHRENGTYILHFFRGVLYFIKRNGTQTLSGCRFA